MVRTTKDAPCHTPVQAESPVRAFLDSHLPIGQLGEQARLLLSNKEPLQVVREITPEDQERLVDKVNQVRYPDYRSFSPIIFSHRVDNRCT